MADSLQLTLDVEGQEQVKQLLTAIGGDVKDLKGAMSEVGDHAVKFFGGQVFASRGQVINQQWPRLSDSYAAWKAKHYPGTPMLVRRGVMKDSFTSKPSSMSVTITNTAPYFKYHQSSASRSKIPRRAMLGIYAGMQDDVTNIIATALSKKIRERTG